MSRARFPDADLKLIVLIIILTPGASPGAGVQYNSQCPDDHNIDDEMVMTAARSTLHTG